MFSTQIHAQVQIGEDIDGEASLELLGSSAISDNGSIIAVGSRRNESSGTNAGQVKVYSNENNQWVQLGSTLSGNENDYLGGSLDLSSDGTILAVTASFVNNYVQVFNYNGTDWLPYGNQIINPSEDGTFAPSSVALSSNGNRIAIGYPNNDDNGSNTGQVIIYDYNGTDWEQVGDVINGVATTITIDERFGSSVSLSADGNRMAAGAPGSGNAEGHVRVYEYDGSNWIKLGFDFGPANQGGSTGASVSLSANGYRIAISVPGIGDAIIYDYDGSEWQMEKYFYFSDASRVSLAADGMRIAISDPLYIWTGDDWFTGEYGRIRIYDFDELSNDWVHLGEDIIGEEAWDQFGADVSISADGKSVIAAAPKNDDNGLDGQGQIRVFNISFNTIISQVSFDVQELNCTEGAMVANNVKIKITNEDGELVSFTNLGGISKALVPNGTYTVTPILDDTRFEIDPLDMLVEFDGIAETRTIYFCIRSLQMVNDVTTTITPLEYARPGFDAPYRITYQNLGTTILNGEVSLQFNEELQDYIESSEIPNNETINTVTYNYTNLQPFETRYIDVTLNTKAPPIVNADDILTLVSQISSNPTDDALDNNTFTLNQTVINSFDPNDKHVLEGDQITIEEIEGYLHYRIRFQNTGTASAINVRVRDVLSDNLNWDTFLPITASHSYSTQIVNGNLVDFNFENILLPAEQDNEPDSHGFVAFKVKPKANIQIGDIITGNANIYFDYNLPIITNTVNTEVVNETLSLNANSLEPNIKVYPNPANHSLYIITKQGVEIQKISLYTVTGQLILETNTPSHVLNLSPFTKGVYFLHLESDKGIFTKKIVIE